MTQCNYLHLKCFFFSCFTETTPEEEPTREAEGDSDSSDTGDEDIPTVVHKRDRASFKAVPEIIQDKGVSGSAATSDTAPSVESSLKKKPLKSALKKPKNPVLPPVVLDDENDDVDSPGKSLKYVSFLFIFTLVIFFLDFESIIETTPRGLAVWA